MPSRTTPAGCAVVSALPLGRRQRAIGGVLVAGPRLTGAAELSIAETLTQAAAIAISHQRELREQVEAAAQLQRALDCRVLIEQAKGTAAARLAISPDAAFELLRASARRHSRSLADIARLSLSGQLPAHDLVAVPAPQASRAARVRQG